MTRSRMLIMIVACAAAVPAPATELGRLFLTPAERAALERVRHAAPAPLEIVPADKAPIADSVIVDEPAATAPVTVNGYIARSAGAPTVWINGADSMQGDLSELGIDVRRMRVDAAQVRVPLTASGEEVKLKPGQSFDPASRHIFDAYDRRPPP